MRSNEYIYLYHFSHQSLYASRNDDVGRATSQTAAGLQPETGHQPVGQCCQLHVPRHRIPGDHRILFTTASTRSPCNMRHFQLISVVIRIHAADMGGNRVKYGVLSAGELFSHVFWMFFFLSCSNEWPRRSSPTSRTTQTPGRGSTPSWSSRRTWRLKYVRAKRGRATSSAPVIMRADVYRRRVGADLFLSSSRLMWSSSQHYF